MSCTSVWIAGEQYIHLESFTLTKLQELLAMTDKEVAQYKRKAEVNLTSAQAESRERLLSMFAQNRAKVVDVISKKPPQDTFTSLRQVLVPA